MDSISPIDLIIFMVGTNDIKIYFNSSAASIVRGCGRLIDLVLKSTFGRNKRAPEILVVAPILILENNTAPHIFDEKVCLKSREFPAQYKIIAEEFSCHYINGQEFAQPGNADGIHLDTENHKKLAAAMYEKVKEILG